VSSEDNNRFLNCQEFEDRLQELLDLRQSIEGDVRLLRHAKACEVCEQVLADYLQLFDLNSSSVTSPFGKKSRSLPGDQQLTPSNWPINKWIWSLAPTFAALLLVMVSMVLDRRPSGYSDFIADSREPVSSRYHAVAAEEKLSIERSRLNAERMVRSGGAGDSVELLSEAVFPRHGIIHRVHSYSHVLYDYTQSQSRFTNRGLLHPEFVDRMTSPLAPIHQVFPWGEKFPGILQVRFFYELTSELIRRTVSSLLDRGERDLGFQTDLLAYSLKVVI
jgi:hypothetical protein